jgi:RNA polymerase sigma-70 factor (ECF subfamily)
MESRHPDSLAGDRAASERAREDAELVRAVARGESDALARLYDRYSGLLLGLAARILGAVGDAEEVLQETFLQVWNQASRYDASRSSVSTWLVLIARSRAIDRLRNVRVVQRTLTTVQQESRETHASSRGVQNVLNAERRLRLREELDRLPAEQREVLELAFYGGHTQSEIAERTGIPLGTVKTRTLLAVKKLRRALADEVEELW